MLQGISPIISPDLLSVMWRMGHGDEIVFADAHFRGDTLNDKVIYACGLPVHLLLDAVFPLFPLDDFVDNSIIMMKAVEGDSADPRVESRYRSIIDKHYTSSPKIHFMERFAFYERARDACAILMTGELSKYGNIILKKGVVVIE